MEVVAEDSYLPSFKEFGQMSLTFFLTVIAWVFFRSETLKDASLYIIYASKLETFDLNFILTHSKTCLLYTYDAADDMQCVYFGGRLILKK